MSSPALPPAKRLVRYFVSYTRTDKRLPGQLVEELETQLRASPTYDFQRWQDTDICPGEKWHEEILQAIEQCDFGLLLVSPAFLGNAYITKHELPQFVDDKRKPCIPLALRSVNSLTQDLKGLEEKHIFQHA